MNKFNVGDRVVLSRLYESDVRAGLLAGMTGVVVRAGLGWGHCTVRLRDGQRYGFDEAQLDHATQEAPLNYHARRERIATAVLAGFATVPNAFADATTQAIRSVQWADALIKELDK